MNRFLDILQENKDTLYKAVVIFGIYFFTFQFGLFLFYEAPTAPAVILTPAGVALAMLILFGYRFWPIIFLASLVSNGIHDTPFEANLVLSVGHTLKAFIGAYVLHRLGFNPALESVRDMLKLITVAVLTPLVLPFLLFLVQLLPYTTGPEPEDMMLVWLGGVLSVIILTTPIVRWISSPSLVFPWLLWKGQGLFKILETIAALLLVFTASFFVWWTSITYVGPIPVALFQICGLLWIALRMDVSRVMFTLIGMAMIALTGIFFGAAELSPDERTQEIISTELYLIVFAILFFIITATTEERKIAIKMSDQKTKKLEEALALIKQADARKGEFIATLAHELRNPLAPIVSNLQIMDMQGINDSPFRDNVASIRKQTKKITRLLEDLLDVARIDQEKIILRKEVIDLCEVVKEAVEEAKTFAEIETRDVSVHVPDHPVLIFADPVRIGQIAINLIQNAMKYTQQGDSIRIQCSKDDSMAMLEVRDSGVGIATDVLPDIFSMYGQEYASAAHSGGGLGIGLSLSKTLTEMHGGTITAESEGRGHGSVFSVYIPTASKEEIRGKQDTDVGTKEEQYASAPSPVRKKRVVVVDDNEEATRTLVQLLSHLGHDIQYAFTGAEAIRVAREHRPDVILLDIGLPDMSGYEVAQVLREELMTPARLIALSGFGQEEDKEKAMIAGFDHHLTKPVSINVLKDLL